jgi:hypothetical protein
MQFLLVPRTGVVIAAALTALLCQAGQDAPAKDAPVRDAKSTPPRAAPADYQAHAQAGTYTVAAEFEGHAVATPDALYSTEDFVVVEVAFFGPLEARLRISFEDFSLRINGKKAPLAATGYTLVFKSLKDPEWVPPAKAEKSKTSIGGGGKGESEGSTPAVVHIPIGVERAMEQRVQKAALAEGEHVLPQAGLIFFQHHGKTDGIRSLELIYSGAAGKASLTLQP